jgi:dihydrofolate reductase
VSDLTEPVDCIILGRKLAEGFIPYWASVAANPDDPQYAAGKKFTGTEKLVFTKTLDRHEWGNTVLAKGDLGDEIKQLKSREGQDIIAYGGGNFVSSLIDAKLIDEFHLFINPTAISRGMAIFNKLQANQSFSLIQSKAFDCGIVVLSYTISPE